MGQESQNKPYTACAASKCFQTAGQGFTSTPALSLLVRIAPCLVLLFVCFYFFFWKPTLNNESPSDFPSLLYFWVLLQRQNHSFLSSPPPTDLSEALQGHEGEGKNENVLHLTWSCVCARETFEAIRNFSVSREAVKWLLNHSVLESFLLVLLNLLE